MRNKILLPIASAILASTLVFTSPALAEENLVPTTASEVYQEEVTTGLEESIIAEVYEDQAEVENGEVDEDNVVTPDTFIYNFKVFFEEVKLFFTFDDEKKAELLAQLANERLLEADLMAERGELELVKELIKAYEEKIAAMEELTEGDSVTEDTYETVVEETYGVSDDVYESEEESEETVLSEVYNYKLKNIAALTMVYNKVPDHVKPIIQRNLQRAIEKREAHIAKKLLKQGNTDTTPVEEVITEEENFEKQAVVEATIEETNEVKKAEKAIKVEKVTKEDVRIDATESSDSDKSRDTKPGQGKEKGKENNNKNNKENR